MRAAIVVVDFRRPRHTRLSLGRGIESRLCPLRMVLVFWGSFRGWGTAQERKTKVPAVLEVFLEPVEKLPIALR